MSKNVEMTNDLLDIIGKGFRQEMYSPYQMIMSINSILKEIGIEKVLPTQMGYTYVKNGYVDSIEVEVGGKVRKFVTKDECMTFAFGYIAKLMNVNLKGDFTINDYREEEKIEEDYSI